MNSNISPLLNFCLNSVTLLSVEKFEEYLEIDTDCIDKKKHHQALIGLTEIYNILLIMNVEQEARELQIGFQTKEFMRYLVYQESLQMGY